MGTTPEDNVEDERSASEKGRNQLSNGEGRDEQSSQPVAHPSVTGGKQKKRKKKKGATSSAQPNGVHLYQPVKTFKLTTDKLAGRCVVAAKDLTAGELIMEEPPFAKVVRQECALRFCAACCKPLQGAGFLQTNRFTAYCCRECKTVEETVNAPESLVIGKLEGVGSATDVDLDLLRMMVRLVVKRALALGLRPGGDVGIKSDGEDAQKPGSEEVAKPVALEESFAYKQWRNVQALMHHRNDMPPEWISVVRAAAKAVMPELPAWTRCDVDEMVELACRVNINAHGLRDDSGSNNVIGVGMFPLTGMLNHSCRPSCTFVYYRGKLFVRALHSIPAGTELTLYYIDLLQSTAERRKELLESKHFLCRCARCESPDVIDTYLAGLCCAECGKDGCLTLTRPPSPEEAIAAQLALLGDDFGGVDGDVGPRGPGGRSKSKKKSKSSRGGGARAIEPTKSGTSQPAHETSQEPSTGSPEGQSQGIPGEKGAVGSSVFYCSSCGKEYPAKDVEEAEARAKANWDIAVAALRTHDFSVARRKLEKWRHEYDAGASTAPDPVKRASKKGRIKLHPMNSTAVQGLVRLANCCKYEEDFSTAARHMRQAVTAMEAVYPPNFPEIGDFYAALAENLTAYLDKTGRSLPPKTRDQLASERKQALSRVSVIRSIVLGEEHPLAQEARASLARV